MLAHSCSPPSPSSKVSLCSLPCLQHPVRDCRAERRPTVLVTDTSHQRVDYKAHRPPAVMKYKTRKPELLEFNTGAAKNLLRKPGAPTNPAQHSHQALCSDRKVMDTSSIISDFQLHRGCPSWTVKTLIKWGLKKKKQQSVFILVDSLFFFQALH